MPASPRIFRRPQPGRPTIANQQIQHNRLGEDRALEDTLQRRMNLQQQQPQPVVSSRYVVSMVLVGAGEDFQFGQHIRLSQITDRSWQCVEPDPQSATTTAPRSPEAPRDEKRNRRAGDRSPRFDRRCPATGRGQVRETSCAPPAETTAPVESLY